MLQEHYHAINALQQAVQACRQLESTVRQTMGSIANQAIQQPSHFNQGYYQ